MAEKVFSKEAVVTAIRLTAQGTTGLLRPEEAKEILETLPEDLADIVVQETCKAYSEQTKVKARVLAKILDKIATIE